MLIKINFVVALLDLVFFILFTVVMCQKFKRKWGDRNKRVKAYDTFTEMVLSYLSTAFQVILCCCVPILNIIFLLEFIFNREALEERTLGSVEKKLIERERKQCIKWEGTVY